MCDDGEGNREESIPGSHRPRTTVTIVLTGLQSHAINFSLAFTAGFRGWDFRVLKIKGFLTHFGLAFVPGEECLRFAESAFDFYYNIVTGTFGLMAWKEVRIKRGISAGPKVDIFGGKNDAA